MFTKSELFEKDISLTYIGQKIVLKKWVYVNNKIQSDHVTQSSKSCWQTRETDAFPKLKYSFQEKKLQVNV